MKRNNFLSSSILILSLLGLSTIFAKENQYVVKKKSASATIKTAIKDCDPGASRVDLDINNVRAKLLNTGDMWWDRSTAKYQVPKVSSAQLANGVKGPNSLFSGSIWVSGKDVSGNLKIAALTFSGSDNEFWPGPLELRNPEIGKSECKSWDQFFTVYGKEIDVVVGEYKKSGAVPISLIADNVKYWPALGNQYLKSDKGLSVDEYMAPFNDVDGDGIYDPAKGDYPVINPACDPTYADQMIFWVINDKGNNHTSTQGNGIGIQINCLAFAFATSNELNDMTFYRYQIINKSKDPLFDTYMSQFVDCDLGNYADDYVGCDTARSLGFVCNSDALDETNGSGIGYQLDVPIQGVDFFEGPLNSAGKQIGMTSFSYFINQQGSDLSDPQVANEFRNIQTGFTRTGKQFTEGGNCIGGTKPTKFCFPGNPSEPTEWSMCSAGLQPQDLRFVQNSGPFTMTSGDQTFITIGSVFVQPQQGSYNGCKINVREFLGKADDLAQNLFDNCFRVAKGPNAPELAIRELDGKLIFNLVNQPTSNNYKESYRERSPDIPKGLEDSTYKFEGYLVYQLISPNVTSNELNDPLKAKLIFQCDLKNDIRDVVNKENIIINDQKVLVDVVKVRAKNEGIKHSFELTEDFFQTLNVKNLVNNKEYYYGALAYATNFYSSPSNKQIKPFLSGANFYVASGIPHKNEVNGVTYNSKFGDGVPVTRIVGRGNSGHELDLLDSTYALFFKEPGINFVDSLTYTGKGSPVIVKIVDPKLVREVDFELHIIDTQLNSNLTPIARNSTWQLLDLTNNDTLFSERDMQRPNEQIMYSVKTGKKYGISIDLSSLDSFAKTTTNKLHYGFLGATIEYKDNLKKWLNLLKDDDGSSYNDWIRGGEVINIKTTENHKSNSNFSTVSGVEFFHDPKNQYSKMLEGKIAPYCLGACGFYDDPANPDRRFITYGPAFRSESNALSRSQTVTGGTTNGSYSPENNLDQIQSVDIVLTNDRSKWTRCVVFETGELYGSNVEGARKGNIRKSTSLELIDLDKDAFGNKDGFKESDNTNDIGRGWFPGFAINVETGERLNMMFGENSQVTGNYAANMIWDPSSINLTQFGEPILGGMHFLYVSNTLYDEGVATRDTMVQFFNQYKGNDQILDVFKRVYKNLMYTAVPLMDSRFDIYKRDSKTKEIVNYELPTDVKIRIRVRRPLETMTTSQSVNYPSNKLVYRFSTKNFAPKIDTVETKKSALDLINIVPNPYYAYSNYENDQLSSIVKITNLPNKCQVFIYDINGALVRKFSKDIDETKIDVSDGQSIEVQTDNLDNSIKWDLKNQVGVPIASGLYYIYVTSPGLGERTLKFFGALRPTDVSSF